MIMCEERKTKPTTLTVVDADANHAITVEGDVKLILGTGLGVDFDKQNNTIYIGISDYWLDNKIKDVIGIID